MRPILFALLSACASDKTIPKDSGGRDTRLESTAPDDSTDTNDSHSIEQAPPDEDGDGWDVMADCDDADASVYPGAAEVCDGLDQDCDGEVDEGVPSDGAGCQEPEAPDWDDTVHTLHITVRTGPDEYDGTDDHTEVCLSETFCETLDNADWDDNNAGNTDVFVWEGLSLSRRAVDRMTLSISDGSDRWEPSCVAVALDGEPVYCNDAITQPMGDDSSGGEALSWTDPAGLPNTCTGCFDAPITHGPIVGATDGDSTQLWLRTDTSRRVELRIATTEEALAEAPATAIVWTEADHDFASTIPVYGLEAETLYWYTFDVEGTRYGPWSFTTARADGATGTTRFGFGSCTRDDSQPIFEMVRAEDLDLFLFVGDNHYGNTSDLGSERQNYRWAHSRDGRAELMMERPILAAWDDHDYVGNDTDGSQPGRDTALRTFQEYWANASYGSEDAAGTFSSVLVGDIQFVLLDDRYYRGLDDSILGDAQEAWLYETLLSTEATFHVLVSGSQFTLEGTSDSWAEFEDAQERLRQFLADNAVGGVFLLSGDIHRSELRWLPGVSGGYDLPELTSSPMANSTSSCTSDDELVACYDDGNSYVRVDVDSTVSDPTVTAVIVAEDGSEVASLDFSRSELGP